MNVPLPVLDLNFSGLYIWLAQLVFRALDLMFAGSNFTFFISKTLEN
jgi:hypothetical protein